MKDPSLMTLQNARSTVGCIECRKPRVLYSKHMLTGRQQTALALLLSDVEYSCGGPFSAPGHSLHGVVTARLPLHCGDPIEVSYYKSAYGPVDLCSYCAEGGGVVDPVLWKQYKTVLPLCTECKERGRQPVCYRPYGRETHRETTD